MSDRKPVALLPCPLCGGEAFKHEEYWRDGMSRGEEPICRSCGCKVPRHWPRRELGAIATWNSRTPPASGPVPEVAGDDLTAVYLLGKRDGRDEAAALLTAQAKMLDEAREAMNSALTCLQRGDEFVARAELRHGIAKLEAQSLD